MRSWKLIGLVVLLAQAMPAAATLTQARSAPARTILAGAEDQTLMVNWVVSTDAAHSTGAISAAGEFFNAATGASLNDLNRLTVGANTGTGPLLYLETVTISAAQIAGWRSQGLRLVGYRRTFQSAGGPAVTAQWIIELRSAGLAGAREAPGGALLVQRMDLDFTDGARIAVVERGSPLAARVSITFTGSGTLRARWEIADPGSQGQPFFRVLALVREPLGGGQSATLTQPALPTQMSGRYALRFCVEGEGRVPGQCADSDTVVQAVYEVLPGTAAAAIRGVTPNGQELSGQQTFRWPTVSGTTTYQLQVFAPATVPDGDPEFVTGLLLPGNVSEAPLSVLMRRKLAAGQRYLWRVTAHDSEGRLIARSELVPFVFQP